ncbi:MAG: dTDP-glucose 4,6-dehydratase [Fibrobacterota bacterium]
MAQEEHRILITGGSGFIGSNLIRLILKEYPHYRVVNLDKLTYAALGCNLQDCADHPNYHFVQGSVTDKSLLYALFMQHSFDRVIHCAAESHVDRSIEGPEIFVDTNIRGTQTLLEVATTQWLEEFDAKVYLQVSTDEVYGSLSLDSPPVTEESPLRPNSPYSASKASADLMVRAYCQTYGFPALITRSTNNFGPFQHPEKLIPRAVTNILQEKMTPLYGTGENIREWIHVEDNCRALMTILELGTPGEVYNVGSGDERSNTEIVSCLTQTLGIPFREAVQYVEDRLGHDLRYAVNAQKLRSLGWHPRHSVETALAETVRWYRSNPAWWSPLRSDETD